MMANTASAIYDAAFKVSKTAKRASLLTCT